MMKSTNELVLEQRPISEAIQERGAASAGRYSAKPAITLAHEGSDFVECVESSSNAAATPLEREQGFASRPDPQNAELTVLAKSLT